MICKKCAHENYCDMAQFGGHVPPITACLQFKEKSLTNADRIRAMTDEELAMFIDDVQKYNIVCRPILCNDCADCMTDLCWQCWREWLKQGVEE